MSLSGAPEPAKKKRRRQAPPKKTLTTEEALRQKEIKHISRRVKQNPVITKAFVSAALSLSKRARLAVEKIPAQKKLLQDQLQKKIEAIGEGEGSAETRKKLENRYGRKISRCDRIAQKFEAGPKLTINSSDWQFLNKMRQTKKTPSGYMLFAQSIRARIKEENPNSTFGDIGRLIGAEWRKTDAEEKKRWNDTAASQKNSLPAPTVTAQ